MHMLVLLPHLLVLHAVLIPAADALHLQDCHEPSHGELVLIQHTSNRLPNQRTKRSDSRMYIPRPWIMAVGSAVLVATLININSVERSSMILSTAINTSFSLACIGTLHVTRIPWLLPKEPSIEKQALFNRYKHGLRLHALHKHRDDARVLNTKATQSYSMKDVSPSTHLSFYVDSGASYHIHHRLSDFINVKTNSTSVSGVDHKSHQCTHIGDLPLLACTSDRKVAHILQYFAMCDAFPHSPTHLYQ